MPCLLCRRRLDEDLFFRRGWLPESEPPDCLAEERLLEGAPANTLFASLYHGEPLRKLFLPWRRRLVWAFFSAIAHALGFRDRRRWITLLLPFDERFDDRFEERLDDLITCIEFFLLPRRETIIIFGNLVFFVFFCFFFFACARDTHNDEKFMKNVSCALQLAIGSLGYCTIHVAQALFVQTTKRYEQNYCKIILVAMKVLINYFYTSQLRSLFWKKHE